MLNQAVFAPWTVGNLPPTTAAWICGEFTATENRSIRPQSRKTLRQALLNLLADDQTQKVFFFLLKRAKKKSSKVQKFQVCLIKEPSATVFPRGDRGDSRLQEIPERARICGGDLRNFELWGRRDPIRSHPTGVSWRHATHTRGGDTGHKYPKDAVVVHRLIHFFLQTVFFIPPNDPT